MAGVLEYLDKKGIKHRGSPPEVEACCPLCEDTEYKMSINLETGLWKCWHANRCGKAGSFWYLQKLLGDEPEGLDGEIKRRPRAYRRPTEEGNWTPTLATLSWFADRRISAETVGRFRAGNAPRGEIMFPYYRDGELVNRKYRDPEDKANQRQEKDAEPALFGRDLVAADADTLLVVEGEPDAMAAWEYGLEAVSVPSGASDMRWIETEWEWLERFRRIVLCLDMDEAGDKGTEAIVKRLGWKWDLVRAELPLKDMNDCLLAFVPEDEVRGCVSGAKRLGPQEVKPLREVPDSAFEKPEPGLPCALPGLTEKLGGWRRGELTIHGGEAASGKTTATCQEAEGLLSRGERVCIASLEMPTRVLVRIMLLQSGMLQPTFRAAYNDLLYFIAAERGIELEKLLDLMAYAQQRFGVGHIVVDSLGCLTFGAEDYWLAQKNAVGKLVRFARDTDVHVHLVHHLRKAGKEQAGKLNHADLEGSAWIRNLADNVLLYRRVREGDSKKNGNLTGAQGMVLVDKNRMQGEEGLIPLSFNRETRKFGGVHDAERMGRAREAVSEEREAGAASVDS